MSIQRTKRTIVVGTDGSPNSHRASAWAIVHAHPGDTVVFVHAWQPYVYGVDMPVAYTIDESGPRELLDAETARFAVLAADHQVSLEGRLAQGDARAALVGAAADLVVVGARGHTGLAGVLLGSVADYVTRHAKVPVVVVPDPDNR